MQRHHTGSGRRSVIPADWEAAHRPVVEQTLTGRVSLREPGTTQEWSDAEEGMVATPKAAYVTDVPARIQALAGQARIVQLAGDEEVIADYLVVLPAARTASAGHLVDVTTSGDPALDGRSLRVEKVVRGTERFERDLFCTLDD